MRCLFASSEIYPLAKTGGLADVAATLPVALASLGIDIRLVMPAYEEALDTARRKERPIQLGDILGIGDVRLIPAQTPDTGLPLWLVDCPSLYQRGSGLYTDPDGRDWPDNAVRFALFCQAVARLALQAADAAWCPDVVHVNDWHLGLVPALLAAQPGPRPASLLTIHNLAFQGLFPAEVFSKLGLPHDWFTADGVEFYGQISFLKAGIRFADRLSTVSPRYAREILTSEFGCGLDGLLRARAGDLVGILNGIDYDQWSPADPSVVPFPYSAHDLAGKRLCKSAVQRELGLSIDPEAPLVVYMSRLTEQKMADALPNIVGAMTRAGGQLAICGTGQQSIEQAVCELPTHHPGRVAVRIGYDEGLARRLLAGADILAAPARFEPCGLTQMYAMRFGTLPIVRCVGGLADTVVDHSPGDGFPQPGTTGFAFREPTADAFADTIGRACTAYRSPVTWRAMQLRAMAQDFRWRRSAGRYLDLYEALARREDCAQSGRYAETSRALRMTG